MFLLVSIFVLFFMVLTVVTTLLCLLKNSYLLQLCKCTTREYFTMFLKYFEIKNLILEIVTSSLLKQSCYGWSHKFTPSCLLRLNCQCHFSGFDHFRILWIANERLQKFLWCWNPGFKRMFEERCSDFCDFYCVFHYFIPLQSLPLVCSLMGGSYCSDGEKWWLWWPAGTAPTLLLDFMPSDKCFWAPECITGT